VTLKIIVNQVT